jgi:hypothetical protein
MGRKYDNGHYFGKINAPIKGTGEYKKTGFVKIGRRKCDVVKWTGKNKQFEYWECNKCYELAGNLTWLESIIERVYGNRCKKQKKGCECCQAWNIYDLILNRTRG